MRTFFLARCINSAHAVCERWLWPSISSDNCITTLRKEEQPRATPPCQFCPEGGNSSHTCMDTQVLHTRRMGEEAGTIINEHDIQRTSGVGPYGVSEIGLVVYKGDTQQDLQLVAFIESYLSPIEHGALFVPVSFESRFSNKIRGPPHSCVFQGIIFFDYESF